MPPEEDTTLELRDYLQVLRRRKWIIAITLIVCVGAAFAFSLTQTPVYGTGAKVLLDESLSESLFVTPQEGGASSNDISRERANEIEIMSSPEVRQRIRDQLGRAPDPVSFSTLGTSDVVEVSAESENAEDAAATANTVAEIYIAVRKERTVADLEGAAAQVQSKIDLTNLQLQNMENDIAVNPLVVTNGRVTDPRENERARIIQELNGLQDKLAEMNGAIAVANAGGATILSPAAVPTEPKNENPMSNILAGLAIGVVLAIALALLREYLDDRIKTKDDLESATGQTVVGLVPALPDWKNRDATELVSVSKPNSPAAEAYRTVRTSVEFLSLDQPIGSLQVTSAQASEGKTTTLANLAVTFARVGQRVIVLCCDLRRPRIHHFFGLSNSVGFTSVLLGDARASEVIQPVRGDLPLGLVASGPLAPNPAELLASKRAVSVIEELDSQCDLLIIDSPPVLPVTDAQVISGLVDGVLLVGSAGSSTKRAVRRAVELLHQVDAPLIGAILNNMQGKHESAYTYGDNRYYVQSHDTSTNGASNGAKKSGRRAKKASARDSR